MTKNYGKHFLCLARKTRIHKNNHIFETEFKVNPRGILLLRTISCHIFGHASAGCGPPHRCAFLFTFVKYDLFIHTPKKSGDIIPKAESLGWESGFESFTSEVLQILDAAAVVCIV